MADIVLSNAVRNNLLSLQNTADLLAKTQERLATGLRVNNALDDPTAFFTASSLTSRANDLNRLLDSVGLGIRTLEAADGAIAAITDMVESAQATARQALQSTSSTATATGTVTGFATGDDLVDTTAINDTDTLTVTVGTTLVGTVTFNTTTQDSMQELLNTLNGFNNVQASLDSSGSLVVEATNGANLTFGGNNTNATTALGLSTTAYTGSVNAERTSLAAEFDALRTQIDQLANDAAFNGINLLQSENLAVIFNEDGTSSLTIAGVDFDSAGLGISASSNNFQDNTSIQTALSTLDTALGTLRSQAATFGSNLSVVENRENFTKNLINVLETGAAGLTLADTNEEGANLLALQTRQQLSSTALSLAAQSDQNVLRLFN
jgi:flagellin-like hook-associated protein FlgL